MSRSLNGLLLYDRYLAHMLRLHLRVSKDLSLLQDGPLYGQARAAAFAFAFAFGTALVVAAFAFAFGFAKTER